MPRKPSPTLKRGAGLILLTALCGAGAGAVELGETTVRSYIGQPLLADIELTALTPEEAASLRVRQASADVYRGANISMSPVLESLKLSVQRREQRQFLHLSSTQSINAGHLNLFLELSADGHSAVRAATIWLAPDPAPAPLPTAVPAPGAALLAARAARMAALPAPAPAPTPMAPPAGAANPPPVSATAPSHPKPELPAVAPPPHPKPEGAVAPAAPKTVPPKPAAVATRPSEAGGAVQGRGKTARECLALDRENAVLNSKLLVLEGKIQVLQQALSPTLSLAKPLPLKPPVALTPLPLKVKPKALKVKPKALKPGAAKPAAKSASFLWPLVGGGVLLLVLSALGVFLYRRGKPSWPSRYGAFLRKPFSRKTPPAIEAPPQEPTIE